jgi:hypothetical protein
MLVRIVWYLVAVSSLAAASLLLPAGAEAQTGTITSGNVPQTGGYGIIVFGGGSSEQLVGASGCPRETAVFWATSGGEFIPFIPATTVSSVNSEWDALFPDGIPANTGIIGVASLHRRLLDTLPSRTAWCCPDHLRHEQARRSRTASNINGCPRSGTVRS